MNWISSKGTYPWKQLLPMGSVYNSDKQIRQSFLSDLMMLFQNTESKEVSVLHWVNIY